MTGWHAAKTLHFVDRRPHVRRHAEALGLQPLKPRELNGLSGMPLSVDSTGTAAGVSTAIKHAAPDGTCVSLASITATSKLPSALMHGRNVNYHLGRSDACEHIPAILDLMSSGALKPELVTSHLGSLDQADRLVREHVLGEATKTIVVE